VHYIFKIHLKPGYSAEDYANGWQRASAIIQQAPGAAGTRLHRQIGEAGTLLAIATWDSKLQRDAMEGKLPTAVQDIIESQMPHVDFEFVGQFEAPEWEVVLGA
jgi:hypothetical protein